MRVPLGATFVILATYRKYQTCLVSSASREKIHSQHTQRFWHVCQTSLIFAVRGRNDKSWFVESAIRMAGYWYILINFATNNNIMRKYNSI